METNKKTKSAIKDGMQTSDKSLDSLEHDVIAIVARYRMCEEIEISINSIYGEDRDTRIIRLCKMITILKETLSDDLVKKGEQISILFPIKSKSKE